MKGLTVIELVIIIALVPVFFSLLSYGFLDFYFRHLLNSEKNTLVDLLLKARHRALVNYLQKPHGVSWRDSHRYLLFVGSSSQERLSQYDEYFAKSSLVEINAPLSEVVFYPLFLKTNASGTIIISTQDKNEKIQINSEGRLSY